MGEIKVTAIDGGGHEARAWVRDIDGERRRLRARGTSATAAKNALKTKFVNRTPPLSGLGDISPRTKIADLTRLWIADLRAKDRLAPQSIDRYETTCTKHLVPAFGGYRLRELTAGRVQAVLESKTSGTATECAKVLRLMLDVAVRHDAMTVNPARQAKPVAVDKDDPRALTVAELLDLRQRAQLWLDGKIDNEGNPRIGGRFGPPPRQDLFDFIDLYLATGVRTAELLALSWDGDVNMDTDPIEVTISGTLVPVIGTGLIRQPKPKTRAGHRVLKLPAFGEEILRRRYTERRCDVVFPSDTDSWMAPGNLRRTWRAARHAAGYDWVELRTMRRTVATLIAEETSSEDAAGQLGHEDHRVTKRHYIMPSVNRAPDLTVVLAQLARDVS